MSTHARRLLAVVATLAVLAGAACSGATERPEPRPPAQPTSLPATPTTVAEGLRAAAEGRYLGEMAPALAETIRAQPWFEAMAPEHLSLIAAVLETDRAAGARGERDSVQAALAYAIEQPWYTDGFEAHEAAGLRGVFQTYTVSLTDWRAPQIGPLLASTIAHQLMAVVELPESGKMVLLVSADDAELGRTALDLAIEWLPHVEAVTGEFPYTFLHISVTELYEMYLGLSYDEFIALDPEAVNAEVMIHELTHSTLYGIFPTWFEEGFAYFMERHLTGTVAEGVAEFQDQVKAMGTDSRLNIGAKPSYGGYEYFLDIATGFLFINGLYEIYGVDEVVETIRSLRSRTFTDQELVKKLVDTADPEQSAALRAYVCANVAGAVHNYCR